MFNTSPLRSISPPNPIDHFLTSQAHGRLDARIWLTCRLALAKSLIEEDSGMGKLGGTSRSITARIGSCEHHCKQGVEEAEAFGDVEMAAEFGLLDFVCSMQHGKISDELISKLEVGVRQSELNIFRIKMVYHRQAVIWQYARYFHMVITLTPCLVITIRWMPQ